MLTRTSKAMSRKIRGLRRARAPRIAKQRKIGQHTGMRQGCTAMHQAEAAEAGTTSARPCVGARSTVRMCTGTHASRHGRALGRLRDFAIFLGLYNRFSFTFGETSETSFGSSLGRNLGFSIVSINSIRERLD